MQEGCRYVGLDHPGASEAAYETYPDVSGDAHQLPFRSRSFDTVMLLEVLEHLPEPHRALREASRVAKVGGTVIVSVPFLYPIHDAPQDFRRWTRFGLLDLVRSAGGETLSITGRARASETGALLLNIALAWHVIHAGPILRPLLVAILVVLVPCINLLGWLGGRIGATESDSFLTDGYLVRFRVSDD